MDTTEIAGLRTLLWPQDGAPLATSRDASDIIGEAFSIDAQLVVIPVQRLSPEFLRLSSGLAGEVLQKFVNYRLRVVILGDVSQAAAASGPLRDFIGECNRGREVWFMPDRAALEAKAAQTA
ncbi:alpha/beta hydrolase [Phenylobacterium sp. Root77]|uniref:DUF4180 domain-containing protein n=1 Tax=unclassified Phenylobacterium TaxID=2640670 RepID=UPI0006FD42FA|nr:MULTISPECIES: DUF4180 domain-containing protein [unclassified Phenylobacterium]KQW70371.1 alpha/beta hydrolase [Phenylobacterium sp. Root1277]KQW91208.1 alpha/beta hydrolase [Phenylobacterium sp. Root1290]KRC39155.1 alpha/beta hydrolase [Phenylobacterium sp. Root77]